MTELQRLKDLVDTGSYTASPPIAFYVKALENALTIAEAKVEAKDTSLANLRVDKERMDWLESHKTSEWWGWTIDDGPCIGLCHVEHVADVSKHETLRGAIDDARRWW